MAITEQAVRALREASWPFEGPHSGGGLEVVYGGGRVFVVPYGDEAHGSGIQELSIARFCELYAAHPRAQAAIAGLQGIDAAKRSR